MCVVAVTMTNTGTNYTSVPNIIITSGVTNTSNLVGGSGYGPASSIQISFSGGGRSGTVITPIVGSGVITSLVLTTSGSGYISPPTVTITSAITGFTNLVGGSGYTNGTWRYHFRL